MYVLKDRQCERCGNDIQVLPYTDKDEYGRSETVVDCGMCVYCGKIDILPQEDYRQFVSQFCIRRY